MGAREIEGWGWGRRGGFFFLKNLGEVRDLNRL